MNKKQDTEFSVITVFFTIGFLIGCFHLSYIKIKDLENELENIRSGEQFEKWHKNSYIEGQKDICDIFLQGELPVKCLKYYDKYYD